MELVVALFALAGFAYFVYRKMSAPKKPGTGTGTGGGKPNDIDSPDKV